MNGRRSDDEHAAGSEPPHGPVAATVPSLPRFEARSFTEISDPLRAFAPATDRPPARAEKGSTHATHDADPASLVQLVDDDPFSRVGRLLAGKYRIDDLLGRGGMGCVYRATHSTLGAPVAVKFLLAEWAARPEQRARFQREAVVLANLRHPGIVSVLDAGEDAGTPYLVMELLSGETLGEYANARGGLLPPDEIARVLDGVLSVLHAAHEAGVIHRDIKPDNVMLLPNSEGPPRVKVLDFGLAFVDDQPRGVRLTAPTVVTGTPLYMSPEQCRGRDVGPPSDVYAVGVVLYEMLAGAPPFYSDVASELMAQHLFATPRPIAEHGFRRDTPPGLEALAMRALAKKPAMRPTVSEFRKMLGDAIAGTDAATAGARSAQVRVTAAALTRSQRMLPEPERDETHTQRGRAVEGTRDALTHFAVALWGFEPSREGPLRAALGMHGFDAAELDEHATEAPRVVLVRECEGAQALVERLRRTRAFARVPILVVDVAAVENTARWIRAGASDVLLAGAADDALCAKAARLARRGR